MQAFGVEVSRRNCVFAYGRHRDGAPAPYSALGDALGSLVRTMEATGPAERDRWRADLVSAFFHRQRAHTYGTSARRKSRSGPGWASANACSKYSSATSKIPSAYSAVKAMLP